MVVRGVAERCVVGRSVSCFANRFADRPADGFADGFAGRLADCFANRLDRLADCPADRLADRLSNYLADRRRVRRLGNRPGDGCVAVIALRSVTTSGPDFRLEFVINCVSGIDSPNSPDFVRGPCRGLRFSWKNVFNEGVNLFLRSLGACFFLDPRQVDVQKPLVAQASCLARSREWAASGGCTTTETGAEVQSGRTEDAWTDLLAFALCKLEHCVVVMDLELCSHIGGSSTERVSLPGAMLSLLEALSRKRDAVSVKIVLIGYASWSVEALVSEGLEDFVVEVGKYRKWNLAS